MPVNHTLRRMDNEENYGNRNGHSVDGIDG